MQGKNYKNGIYQILAEGEKAAKNQTVFRYYGKDESKIQDKIEEVNKKIQTALEKEKNYFPSDVKNLEEQIDDQIQDLKTTNDVQRLSEYKKRISDVMLKKAKIAGENSKSRIIYKKAYKTKRKL